VTSSDAIGDRPSRGAAAGSGIVSLGPLPRLLWAATLATILWTAVAWALA